MRRYLCALLGMSLLASVNGCVTTAVGGGPNAAAGTYSYLSRNLEVIYGIPLADVWPRALAAVESLQLHIDRQRIDGLGGDIQARRPDGTKVVYASNPSGTIAQASRCASALWGTEMSERVQRTIRQQIGI